MLKKITFVIFLFTCVLAVAKDTISMQLHWKHQFQYAGFYAAIEKGYYKEFGITLDLKEWNSSIDKLNVLRQNKVDLIVGASDMLGETFKSDDLIIISAYLQKTPVSLAVKSDIYFPSDLKNRKIMAVKKDIESSVFYKLFQTAHINTKNLNIIPHNFKMDSFINGDVDGIQVYITDQLYELASKNVKFNIIDANSYDVDFYDLMVITTNEFASKNPQLMQNFKEATKKGWEYALNNKEEIVDLIVKKYNTQQKSKQALLFEANRLENYILPKHYNLGELDKEKLKKIALLHLEMENIQKINNMSKYIFSYKNFDRDLNLTPEEKAYLKNKKILNICTIPNGIYIDKNKFYKSIDIRLIEDIAKKLQIKHQFIQTNSYEQSVSYTGDGICDILSITRATKKRQEILNISKPFIAQPLVMVTNNNVLYIDDFSKLKNKTIGISHGHLAIKTINKLYPNLKIIELENPQEGLKLIKQNKIFGFIDIPISISHHIKQLGYLYLKIVGSLHINSGLSMASTKKEPILEDILEKSMNLISEDYINTLINEWYAIKYEKGIDYTLVWQTIIFTLLLLSAMLYWNRKIHRTNILLEETQNEIKNKNKELEQLSITDRLTGLYNRHKIDKVLKTEKARLC